jgi:diguanylate cyclase (GGDEF)-like protein
MVILSLIYTCIQSVLYKAELDYSVPAGAQRIVAEVAKMTTGCATGAELSAIRQQIVTEDLMLWGFTEKRTDRLLVLTMERVSVKMLSNLTVAHKINLLVLLLSMVGSAAAGGFLAFRELSTQREAFFELLRFESARGVDQQVALYFADQRVLDGFTNRFFASPGVRSVTVTDQAGTEIVSRSSPESALTRIPDFSEFRQGANPLRVVLSERRDNETGERLLDYSLPLFSVVNPLERGLTRLEYLDRLARAQEARSEHVSGYLQLVVSADDLFAVAWPGLLRIGMICLLCILVCMLFTLMVTRRVTEPLSKLSKIAEQVSNGQLVEDFKVTGSGEVRQVAGLLGTIIGGLNSYKTRMDVDHQLLSMKVEERTAQLSQRNQELNEAVEEVTRAKNQLREMAYYDSLTLLPNRRLFTEQLKLLLRVAKRQETMLALLFIDLDNFKRINDSLGHSVGDILLRDVANRLSCSLRESDLVSHYVDMSSDIGVSRLGGDEFTVVLNQIRDRTDAESVARRLMDALTEPMVIEGHELVVTPSIGIAIAPEDAEDVEGLLRRADIAMYHSKSSGKNGYHFYVNSMQESGTDRLKLESDLRRAIEQDEIVIFYQPQVDIETGNIVGAEALVRWQHPERGLLSPFHFIPVAEEMGLISDLGDLVLRKACRDIKDIQDDGLPLSKVAVNVSSLQFNDSFTSRIRQFLREINLDAGSLELELTEGIIMANATASVSQLGKLKELGVSLSVDDFGTGYSSLAYLSRFPLDILKIDRSFVTDYDKSARDAGLVSAIIAMGNSLELDLVAEGVETAEQYLFLKSSGVGVIQGYLFSKPVPVEELTGLLQPGAYLGQIQEIESEQAWAQQEIC